MVNTHSMGIVRIGRVSSVDTATACVRVVFEDQDNVVSAPLPMLYPSVQHIQEYRLPSVGEPVACVFLSIGFEDGFCLGAYYSPDNLPPIAGNVAYWQFSDTALVLYNLTTGKLQIVSDGEIEITAASTVTINANLTVHGSITADDDVTGDGISLTGHVHGGVNPGMSVTGAPE